MTLSKKTKRNGENKPVPKIRKTHFCSTLHCPLKISQKTIPDVAEFKQKCPKCGRTYKIYAKFVPNPKIDVDYKGFAPFPKDVKIICSCGFEIDLSDIKN